jgi:hypothetical protein
MALEELAERKFLETKSGYGVPLFWLTKSEPLHSAIKSAFAQKMHNIKDTIGCLTMSQMVLTSSPCSAMVAVI